MIKKFFLTFLLFSLSKNSNGNGNENKFFNENEGTRTIYNGETVHENEKIWYVPTLVIGNAKICSGVMIDDRVGVSAAHCFAEEGPRNEILACMNFENEIKENCKNHGYKIRDFQYHYNYHKTNVLVGDVAVFVLDRNVEFPENYNATDRRVDFEFNNVTFNENPVNSSLTLYGWGSTADQWYSNEYRPPTHLMKIDGMSLLSQSKCIQLLFGATLNSHSNLDVNNLCLYYNAESSPSNYHKIPCGGDSGGPVFENRVSNDGKKVKVLVGLTSWSTKNTNVVFLTNLATVLDFVKLAIKFLTETPNENS